MTALLTLASSVKLGLGENIDLVRLLCSSDRIRIDMKECHTVQHMNRVAGAMTFFNEEASTAPTVSHEVLATRYIY